MTALTPGFWQKLDRWARASAPTISVVFLVVLSVVPWPLAGYGAVAPLIALVGIYYWIIHRPELMPFSAIFAIGLVQDLLTAGHPGVNAFVFLVAAWAVLAQRRTLAGLPVLLVWFGFAMTAGLAAGLEWAVASALAGEPMAARATVYRALVTAACYPLVALALHPILRALTPERAGPLSRPKA